MNEDLDNLHQLAKKYNVFLLDDDEEDELGKLNEELDRIMMMENAALDDAAGGQTAFTFNKQNSDFTAAASFGQPIVVGTRLS